MRAGELRHVVTIQTLSEAHNGVENVPSVASSVTRRAKIEQTGGSETQGTQQTRATATYLMTIRHHALSPLTHQISWDGRTFGIEDVENVDGRKIETRFRAVEVKRP